MISLQPVTTADAALYKYVEQLLVASFPEAERRPLDDWRAYTDHEPRFHNNAVLDDGQPVGLMTYWDFDRFGYAEHFAIDPARRNGGLGQRVMQHLCQQWGRPFVLEVEMPDNDLARRRIGFYQRQGLVLWDALYQQPPYRPGDGFLPMRLMAHGDLQCTRDYEHVRSTIYREVYHADPTQGTSEHHL